MTEVWNKLPPNPEQDAFHILADGDIQYVVRWKPSRGWMDEYLPIWADECSYVGQLYTEAEVRAERDRLREALLMWLDADDAGDGQECINAIAHARAVLEGAPVPYEPTGLEYRGG
jgi:hypothetical protein